MDHSPPPPAPARQPRRTVLVALAILGVAISALVVRPAVGGSEADGVVPDRVAAWVSSPPWSADGGRSTGREGALGEADGVIPDGAAVSVFDGEVPAVGRLDPALLEALRRATTDAEADGVGLRVNSGWRSAEHQRQLVRDAVAEYGSAEEAARWVATPETSAHVSGDAVDIGPFDAAAWLDAHGAAHGLCRTYANEPWHFELRPGAPADGCPPMYADPTEDPRMQP